MIAVINPFIKFSVIVIFLMGSSINISLANTYFESISNASIYDMSASSYFIDSKMCIFNNKIFNNKFIGRIPVNQISFKKRNLSNSEIAKHGWYLKNLPSSVIYTGDFRLTDYIYKVTDIFSDTLLRTKKMVIKIGVPKPGEWILLLAGFGLVCLQISRNSFEDPSSYLISFDKT